MFKQVTKNKNFSRLVLIPYFLKLYKEIQRRIKITSTDNANKSLNNTDKIKNDNSSIINSILNDFFHYQLYKKELNSFDNAYNNFTNRNKITPNEANALRHIGASLYFGSKYGNDTAYRLGLYNELLNAGSSGTVAGKNDRKIDLYNNHIGRTQSEYYSPNITPEEAINRSMDLIQNTTQPAINYYDPRALNYRN